MILTAAIFVPLLAALVLALVPQLDRPKLVRALGTAVAAVPLALLGVSWLRFDPEGPVFQLVTDQAWIAAIGAGYRIGVDGIALPLAVLSAVLFVAAIAYPVDYRGRARSYVAWMLFLEGTCLGFFLSLDLLLFYVFFDLSLVGMYFLIGLWGHENRERAALKFLIFTLAGSLVMLLGVLSLALAVDPMTFDMRELIARQPLAGEGVRAGLSLLAIMFGLAVKTPLVPVHTWLPAAHVEAPGPASAILAGVLLKMGTYGMIRVAYSMMRESFERYAMVLATFAVISIVYGAFVALGQKHIKRRIAYTSITHLGYTALGIALVASVGSGQEQARRLALTGATLEMVAHGLITGALFLLAGSLHQRGESFEMSDYGGLARPAPRMAVLFALAAFASFGMPGFVGFVAELQIFSSAVAMAPWRAVLALVGVVITAALFLQLLHALFLGGRGPRSSRVDDLGRSEVAVVGALVVLAVVLGILPAPLVDVIDATAEVLVHSDLGGWVGS